MKKFLFLLLLLPLCLLELKAQLSLLPDLVIPELKKPIQYHGILDIGALLVFQENNLGIKGGGAYGTYYFAKKKHPNIMGGFVYRFFFQKQFDDVTDFQHLNELEHLKHINFSQHYFSGRIRFQTHRFLLNPYAAIGAGWLLQAHIGVKDVPNAEYDPNHTCPEGSPLTITKFDNLNMEHQLAYDIEAGLLIGKGRVKGHIGISYMRTQKATKYPSVNNTLHPNTQSIGEPRHLYTSNQTENLLFQEQSINQNTLQWKQRMVNPVMLKLGVSFRIFTDPNRVCSTTNWDNSDDPCSSSSSSSSSSNNNSNSSNSSSSRCGK